MFQRPHCLYDILARHASGEWQIEIPVIISNHELHREISDRFDIPFYYFDITGSSKSEIEAEQRKLLADLQVDFLILAR